MPEFNSEMTPEKFVRKAVELYRGARKSKFPHDQIVRGRSHQMASSIEDLVAYFLASNNAISGRQFRVDQYMRIDKHLRRYPDITVIDTGDMLTHTFDVKTDMGWKRSQPEILMQSLVDSASAIRGKSYAFRDKSSDELHEGRVASNAKSHLVIISEVNSGTPWSNLDASTYERDGVYLYRLSHSQHPNAYGISVAQNVREIECNVEDFVSMIARLNDQSS